MVVGISGQCLYQNCSGDRTEESRDLDWRLAWWWFVSSRRRLWDGHLGEGCGVVTKCGHEGRCLILLFICSLWAKFDTLKKHTPRKRSTTLWVYGKLQMILVEFGWLGYQVAYESQCQHGTDNGIHDPRQSLTYMGNRWISNRSWPIFLEGALSTCSMLHPFPSEYNMKVTPRS